MSKFNSTSSSFFKRNTYQLDIKSKSSQKQQKKNNKATNTNSNVVTDNDFNKLMEENNNLKNNSVKLSDYLLKIDNSEVAKKIIQEQIMGSDLVDRIKYENITGTQLLKEILNKYSEPSNYEWVEPNQYGLALEFLLKDNLKEQLLCLLLTQNYSNSLGFPKINYKNKQVYFLKMIFQLLFTYDIIDESVYWEWQEVLINIVDIDENTKSTICIQTTEFFNILKMTFTDEDYETNDNGENQNDNQNPQLKTEKSDESEDESESEPEPDKYKVPEEQDYNMDDNEDFNLDDL